MILSRDSFLSLLLAEADAFYADGRAVRHAVCHLYRSLLRRVGRQYDAGGRSAGDAAFRAELNVATQIQSSMLPCVFPAFPEYETFDIYASMNPAKEVGGDFYDFFLVDEDHLALVMADVSGKGVPAAPLNF